MIMDDTNNKMRKQLFENKDNNSSKELSIQDKVYNTLDETNEIVDEMSGLLDDLKTIQIETGKEISVHNKKLDKLSKDTCKANVRAESATSRARNIIKKS